MNRSDVKRSWLVLMLVLLAVLGASVLTACGGAPNDGGTPPIVDEGPPADGEEPPPADGEEPPPADGEEPPTALDPLNPDLAYLTDLEAAERAQALKNDAISIANGFVDGALNAAAEGVPYSVDPTNVPNLAIASVPVPHLVVWNEDWTVSALATGTFEYDEDTRNWTYAAQPTNELIARWRSESAGTPFMELSVVWESLASVTYPVGSDAGLPDQVPTGWHAVLLRNGVAIADVDATFAFRSCDGVLMAEPTRMAFQGFAGDGAARADVHEFSIEAVGDDRVKLSTDLDVRSGSLQFGIEALLSADVALERDAQCWPMQPDSIEFSGELRVAGPGPLVLVRGDVTASYDAGLGTYDLVLRDGRFLSGDKRVDLVATIAADEADPASRLFLTFANGVVRDAVDFVNAFGLAD